MAFPMVCRTAVGCPIGSPNEYHILSTIHESCHGATMHTPPGVAMEPPVGCPMNATMAT